MHLGQININLIFKYFYFFIQPKLYSYETISKVHLTNIMHITINNNKPQSFLNDDKMYFLLMFYNLLVYCNNIYIYKIIDSK